MSKPKVSICIPTYKQVDYLRNTLESILAQNYTDYEIIITDDSPDNSVRDLVREFDFKDKLKYYKNEKQLGSPENWNESVRKASGEYIKIMHHDDWFRDENGLAGFVEMLDDNQNIDFAFSASETVEQNGKFVCFHIPTKEQINIIKHNIYSLFWGNIIGAPSVTIYRKKAALEYDKKMRWLVDIDFYIRMLEPNKAFGYCNKPLIKMMGAGEHQVTREFEKNKLLQIEENIYLYKKIISKMRIAKRLFFNTRLVKSKNFVISDLELSSSKLTDIPMLIITTMKYHALKSRCKRRLKNVIFSKP